MGHVKEHGNHQRGRNRSLGNRDRTAVKHPKTQKSWQHWALAGVFAAVAAAALYLRLLWVWYVPTEQLYDFSTYYEIAVNVFSGKGYTFMGQPIAFQGMGYSYLLGLFFKAVGDSSELTAKYFNVFWSMFTLFASWYIVKKLTKRPLVQWGTYLWVAFLPHHIAYCNAIGTEVFSAALLAGTLAVQLSGLKNRYKWPLLGIVIGVMTLTKPFFLAYPLAIGLYEWFGTKNWKPAIASFLVVFVFMWAVLTPWTLRNYRIFHRFIPVSYNSGLVLYLNNNASNVHGGFMPLENIEKTPELAEKINEHLQWGNRSLKLASDLEVDLKPAAKAWISENPVEFMKLGLIRIHSTLFNGAWDIDAWTMNGKGEAGLEKEKPPTDGSASSTTGQVLTEKEKKAKTILWQRQINFFRAVNDTSQSILTSFGAVFVLANLPLFFKSLFSRKRLLEKQISIPMLNIGFICAVILVYEGQPRYNFPMLFLLAYCTMQVISLMVDYGKSHNPEQKG